MMDVDAGCAMMKSFRYSHWPPAPVSIESSIKIERKSASPFFQSPMGLRSFPWNNWTSSFAMLETSESFFGTAVTVKVTLPLGCFDCACAREGLREAMDSNAPESAVYLRRFMDNSS